MGIFNEFNKKEKPVFTGSRFGFGSGPAGPPGAPAPISVTGGNSVDTGSRSGFNLHIFTSPGNLVVTGGPNTIEMLIVGGGGGGGSSPVPGSSGGGGGGGGAVFYRPVAVSAGTHPVTVGTYGNGNAGNDNAGPNGQGGNGGPSSIVISGTPHLAAGGGGGGGSAPPHLLDSNDGAAGGSGGGGGNQSGYGDGGPATGATGHPGIANANVVSPPVGWGNPGGSTPTDASGNAYGASGGGGGSQAGQVGNQSGGADGGHGVAFTWIPTQRGAAGPNSSARYFGGGGGGSAFGGNGPGGGGRSGGGNGGGGSGGPNAQNGSANTGSGGGGDSQGKTAGDGGTGIVIAMIPTAAL